MQAQETFEMEGLRDPVEAKGFLSTFEGKSFNCLDHDWETLPEQEICLYAQEVFKELMWDMEQAEMARREGILM